MSPRLLPTRLAGLKSPQLLGVWTRSALILTALLPPLAAAADLESLDLDVNWFSTLPRALAGATALTCLSLRNNEELEFKQSDVEDVLAHLPRLAELRVWGSGYSHYLHEGLQASLPQLTINALRPKRQELIPLAHQEMHLQ